MIILQNRVLALPVTKKIQPLHSPPVDFLGMLAPIHNTVMKISEILTHFILRTTP